MSDALRPKSFRIFLHACEVPVDIGFHEFEIGNPQRLLIDVDIDVEEAAFAATDDVAAAWDYDFLRSEIRRLAGSRRFNLQETFARAIYDSVAARPGVVGLKVTTRKPDIYADCGGVGVEIASG